LQALAFGDQEVLVQAQVCVEEVRSRDIAHGAGSEGIRSRVGDVGRVDPLNYMGNWQWLGRLFRMWTGPSQLGRSDRVDGPIPLVLD
jgi:hypothetical protein